MYNKSFYYESITESGTLCRKIHENGTTEYFHGDKLYVKKEPSLISFQTYLYDHETEMYNADTIHFNFYGKIICCNLLDIHKLHDLMEFIVM